MSVLVAYKKEVEQEIIEAIATGLEKHELSIDALHDVAEKILKDMELLRSKEDTVTLLRELNKKWPIFRHLLAKEEGAL